MTHFREDQIRAFIDGEFMGNSTADELNHHLQYCPKCREKMNDMQAQKLEVQKRLEFMSVSSNMEEAFVSLPATYRAYAKLLDRINDHQEDNTMFKWLKPQFRVVGIAVLIMAILVIMLSFPSGRSLAGQFLGIFRVQQVKFLPIETNILETASGNTTLSQRLGEILSRSINVLRESGEPQPAADALEASQLAGFTVRLPTNVQELPKIFVQGGAAFEMTIDRGRLQAFLEEAGRGDLMLPESLDGAVITIDIPKGVSALYGECPAVNKGNDDQDSVKRRQVNYPNCIIFSMFASPTVNTPPDLDLNQLIQLGLEFSGWSAEDAQAFIQQIDWTSTLVVPIPKRDSRVEQVIVDGVEASLIIQETSYLPRYALVWVKDGIIYAFHGWGVDASPAIEMGNRLPQG